MNPTAGDVELNTRIPKRIGRLDELAYNLWWSWHNQARQLFRSLDFRLWRVTGHNPVKLLREVSPDVLRAAAGDPDFLALYDSVMAAFDDDMTTSATWLGSTNPGLVKDVMAYFSMEFAIHSSLPMYAGGLGVLAGDICKEAGELGLPMVAVGFMYPQGYFQQRVAPDGWQNEIYRQLNFSEAPISRVLSAKGDVAIAKVEVGDVTLEIGVWLVRVGRTKLYLLDTNLDENPVPYRQLSARLYVADRELRIQQEVVLGIGGVRALRALGINPALWHANEGHTAFMMLERIREELVKGLSFSDAVEKVRAATIFTTHTPVLAGHDMFPVSSVKRYLNTCCQALGISWKEFFELGQDNPGSDVLNMTALAMKLSGQRCAVSKLHGKVTQRMWHTLWPDLPEEKVPIGSVTNGIHVPTWISPEMYRLYARYLGADWIKKHDDPKLWERVMDIPDEELWRYRRQLDRKLAGTLREHVRKRWVQEGMSPKQMLVGGMFLDPDVLTIAFARRFSEYKRATLIFTDTERLKRIITNRERPVQFIFAGKSHPADFPSKILLQRVYNLAQDDGFQGRIAFVEDYDMHMARDLIAGVDVWLNAPRRLQEASGTSGMKACLNGALHMSVLDGWWYEGYNGKNGWAIGSEQVPSDSQEEDRADAETLYRLLEDEVVPLYYTRDRNGIPRGWIAMVKESIRTAAPRFSARRMLKEYATKCIAPEPARWQTRS
ncbi:MAG: alpha-glucan family phosphorylase [Chloroflexi bacterium]|nr:alpha-glucan family phosphorylase [Chloroflexota bacterium]